MSGRQTAVDVHAWAEELQAVGGRIGQHFTRSEPRRRALDYVRGLLSDAQRKNGWQLAEFVGDRRPYGVQHLLGRADWDADAVRDDLRAYVMDHLVDPQGVLIVDETGFLKKGTKSAGVQRQYSGTAGRIENCQIGVFLAFAGKHGHAFLDRELYLPRGWADDAERRRGAAIPAGVAFATKPQMARRMLARAFAAGVKAAWVTADEVYGCDSALRRWLEERRQPYVLAIRSDQRLWVDFRQVPVAGIAAAAPAGAWRRLSCGAGVKGPRWYDWWLLPVNRPSGDELQRWLLVRRRVTDPTDRAYYFAAATAGTPLERLVEAAGMRWAVECGFEAAKGECGLADYEVRSWPGWYRHVTLALFAHALLAVIRARAAAPGGRKKGGRG
jgi:SRSO17 transposase